LFGGDSVWHKPRKHEKTIGVHLQRLRKQQGVTQAVLAERLDKPQSFVSSYERGERRIDLLEFVTIVSALGADPRIIGAQIFDALAKPARSARSR
jgi:transcriptional regulator with XRE-family HTH domain